jgi:ElaB/YqjD/DUF883 family membrane-anchored ribosome-binding protein
MPETQERGLSETSLTRAEVEAHLNGKSEEISRRITAIQKELATAGSAMKERVLRDPLVFLGGSLAVGLVVGALLKGRGRRRDPYRTGNAAQALVEEYIDSVVADMRHQVADGREPGMAVREALHGRVPLIFYAPEAAGGGGGKLRALVGFIANTAIGIGLNLATDYLQARLEAEVAPEPSEEGHE